MKPELLLQFTAQLGFTNNNNFSYLLLLKHFLVIEINFTSEVHTRRQPRKKAQWITNKNKQKRKQNQNNQVRKT